jgi:hypothetical protein
MHKSPSSFNLITAVHVSGVTVTHLQEHKTNASTASGNHYTVLLSAAIAVGIIHQDIITMHGTINIKCNVFSLTTSSAEK